MLRYAVCVLSGAVALMLLGCYGNLEMEARNARESVEVARRSGAATLAPDDLRVAELALQEAEAARTEDLDRIAPLRRPERVRRMFADAVRCASTARQRAETVKAQAQIEASVLLEAVRSVLDSLTIQGERAAEFGAAGVPGAGWRDRIATLWSTCAAAEAFSAGGEHALARAQLKYVMVQARELRDAWDRVNPEVRMASSQIPLVP